MILISKSLCICGKCGTKIEIEWDLEPTDSYEKDMGINTDYESIEEVVCEECGNVITARLWAIEYPPGTLEDSDVVVEGDEVNKSVVEKPHIEFFDL